jgi:hypothetical protein
MYIYCRTKENKQKQTVYNICIDRSYDRILHILISLGLLCSIEQSSAHCSSGSFVGQSREISDYRKRLRWAR